MARMYINGASDDIQLTVVRNTPLSINSQTNQDSENLKVDSSTENPTGGTTNAERVKLHCFLKGMSQNKALVCHCDIGQFKSEYEDLRDKICFQTISSMKCNKCKETMNVNPYWKFDEYTDVKDEIFRFLRYHNPTGTLCCNEKCTENDEVNFVPAKQDRFGIVSSVGCIKCGEEMSLEMNTANSHKFTVIEKAGDLKTGDEIMFRRWYGISHHAIYLGKKEPEENNGCCSGCGKCFQSSDEFLDVVSHTFDKEQGDPRVKQSGEWLQGGSDVYRVEYESCYHPKWTEWNAKRAQHFVTVCKEEAEKRGFKFKEVLQSNYDPLMENCEHFARRCKTGQSESIQVKACLYDCGKHIAMFALRVSILATWWISQAVVEELVIHGNATNSTLKAVHEENRKLEEMEVIEATLLCVLFLTLKVVLSSIEECRKIRQCQELTMDEEHGKQKTKKTAIGRYVKSCSECCCKCCPKQCYGFRYFCRMLFCLVPFRLCKEFFISHIVLDVHASASNVARTLL